MIYMPVIRLSCKVVHLVKRFFFSVCIIFLVHVHGVDLGHEAKLPNAWLGLICVEYYDNNP